jgi:hypothetical protein
MKYLLDKDERWPDFVIRPAPADYVVPTLPNEAYVELDESLAARIKELRAAYNELQEELEEIYSEFFDAHYGITRGS